MLKGANLALAFLIEIAMLLAFGNWAYRSAEGGIAGWVAVAIAVIAAAALWGVWAAPRSKLRLSMPWLVVFKIIMFVAAVLALWAVGLAAAAVVFAVVVALNLVLAAVWKQV